MEDRSGMAEFMPQLLADVRREGCDHDDSRFQSLPVHAALLLRQGEQVVVALHETGDDRVQAEVLKSLGDRVDHLVARADHLAGGLDVLILILHDQVVEPAQEAVYAVDASVVPLRIQLGRTDEQLVHAQGIAAVILHQLVRGNHVALGLAHLDAVLAGDHALVEQLVERLLEIDGADVIQELGVEPGVKQVQHGVLHAADVHIHGQVLVRLLLGDQLLIVVRIHIAQEVPGGTGPLGHRVRLALRGGAALRALAVHPGVDRSQR